MKRIAFVTYPGEPDIYPDDGLAAKLLAARGVQAVGAVWSDPAVAWGEFELVIVRSTWDYCMRFAEFHAWLNHLEKSNARVFNPVPLLRWNSDKTYLEELAAQGIPTLRVRRIKQGTSPTLSSLLEEEELDEAVVKPSISGAARRTFRVNRASANACQSQLAEILEDGDALLQPFQKEVVDPGERSLIFFNSVFSHAIVKKPASGDFRTQPQLGAAISSFQPDAKLLQEAQRALAAAKFPTLYGRVDGVVVDGEFRLMELELLEPYLFLATSPGAAGRFAEAILAALNR